MCTKILGSARANSIAGALVGAVLLGWSSFTAQAFPAAEAQAGRDGGVTLVAEHCGVGWWRGPEGHCHPDRERVVVDPLLPIAPIVIEPGRVCPFGTHLGPHRRECIR